MKRVLTEHLKKPIKDELSLDIPPSVDCDFLDITTDHLFDNQLVPDDIFEDAVGLYNDMERQISTNYVTDHTYCCNSPTPRKSSNSSSASLLEQMLRCPQGNEERLAIKHKKSFPTPSPTDDGETEWYEPFLKQAHLELPDSPISVDSIEEERYFGLDSGGSSPTSSTEDKIDINFFVISPHEVMECSLCFFRTRAYSSFKSHIICNHPYWRITKKLSKSRLLVERVERSMPKVLISDTDLQNHMQNLRKIPSSRRNSTEQYCHVRSDPVFQRNRRLYVCVECHELFVFEGSAHNHVIEQHELPDVGGAVEVHDAAYACVAASGDHGQSWGPVYRCLVRGCFFTGVTGVELQQHSRQHKKFYYKCLLCHSNVETNAGMRRHAEKHKHLNSIEPVIS